MLQPRSEDADLRLARETTHRVARTFALACRMLPRDVRDDVYRLYLVFRTLDDLVDDGDPRAAEQLAVVEAWSEGGAVASRETRTLEDLDRRHGLPREAFWDFCKGMRHDLAGARVCTEEDLDRYCYQVAGTVGIVMTAVLGADDPEAARHHAAVLGRAMQRTNILRDIDEDLAAGRVYVAEETRRRFDAMGLQPGRREALLRDQIDRADALFEEGAAGIPMLRRGRRAISAAGTMYREILRQIERDGYGARPGRAVVPGSRKLLIAARALA